MLGGTGCGKSTFCHLITGSDPRTNIERFLAAASSRSVTRTIEMIPDLDWFDGDGKLTLIDCPGLSDSENKD